MRLLIDTSIAIHLRDSNRLYVERLEQLPSADLLLSAVSLVELEGGLHKDPSQTQRRRERLLPLLETVEVLAFDEEAARTYGEIIEQIGFSRPKILNRMIAAHALVSRSRLVTANRRDFEDVPGLQVEDWSV